MSGQRFSARKPARYLFDMKSLSLLNFSTWIAKSKLSFDVDRIERVEIWKYAKKIQLLSTSRWTFSFHHCQRFLSTFAKLATVVIRFLCDVYVLVLFFAFLMSRGLTILFFGFRYARNNFFQTVAPKRIDQVCDPELSENWEINKTWKSSRVLN